MYSDVPCYRLSGLYKDINTSTIFVENRKETILLSSPLTFGMTDNMFQFSMLVKQHEIFRGEGHVAGEGRSGT